MGKRGNKVTFIWHMYYLLVTQNLTLKTSSTISPRDYEAR